MSSPQDLRPISREARLERLFLGLVRCLLGLYPRSSRRRFGDEILEVVRCQWQEETAGRRSLGRFALRTTFDLARQGARQRVEWGVTGLRSSRLLSRIESWADALALMTSSVVWVAFVGSLAQPAFEWGLFGATGSGIEGAFPSLGLLTALAVGLPLANGCASLRVQRGVRTVWLGFWTLQLTLALLRWGPGAAFRGDAWGVRISVLWFLVPTAVLTLATLLELVSAENPPRGSWAGDWRSRAGALAIAALLVPLQQITFAQTEGVTGPRLAVTLTLVQWLLLWLVVFRPAEPQAAFGDSSASSSERSTPTPTSHFFSEILR